MGRYHLHDKTQHAKRLAPFSKNQQCHVSNSVNSRPPSGFQHLEARAGSISRKAA